VLEPVARSDKVYALLREAMMARGVVGIARLVMHTKEHLAALVPTGPALTLDTLRWATELRSLDALELPAAGRHAAGLREAELKMAGELIEGMTTAWNPEQYHDQFAEAIRKLVAAKAAAGGAKEVTPVETMDEAGAPSNVVDLTTLLRNSLGPHRAKADGSGARGEHRPAASKRSARAPAARKAPAAKPAAARRRA
jgi:DNA end-binding protein Ku